MPSGSRPPAPRGLHHVALPVRRLDAAEAFYAGILGLRVLARHDDAQGRPRSIWVEAGEGTILMLERVERPVVPERGPPVLAFAIPAEDRARWEGALESAGVPLDAATDFTLYVRDPDGNRIGLSHYPERRAAGAHTGRKLTGSPGCHKE